MKAAVFHRPKKVTVDEVPDPKLENQTDAIVRVTATAICGSDLHIYNGLLPQLRPLVLGHEFMGIVEEVGPEVTNLKKGDRVVVPFNIACGTCFFCKELNPGQCETSNKKNYGPEGGLLKQKGGGLFGYTDLYGGYDGGQAELVRVPFANFGPRKVPESLTDEQVLFLTDIFPTGYSAVRWCDPKGGETYAVFGAGPVGIMAAKAAWLLGAARVIVLDREPYRLEIARATAKAEIIDVTKGDHIEKIREMTGGRGADICIDAVGMEAHRGLLDKLTNVIHAQMGSIDAFKDCVSAVRRGGIVSVVGVYGVPFDNFPIGQIFDKGLRLQFGQAQVHRFIDDLIVAVEQGKVRLDDVITHRLPLSKAGEAYETFNAKKDNCEKVVLKP
jgi:S-(hydroxymethyl)glutathione dehydrogenase / alcohol dehydrogenase